MEFIKLFKSFRAFAKFIKYAFNQWGKRMIDKIVNESFEIFSEILIFFEDVKFVFIAKLAHVGHFSLVLSAFRFHLLIRDFGHVDTIHTNFSSDATCIVELPFDHKTSTKPVWPHRFFVL
jgi:hypothetical protein